MSTYPPDVEVRVKFLDEYKVNEKLNRFDIFHLYPKGLAYPNGYYDSQFFEIVAFNTKKMESAVSAVTMTQLIFGKGALFQKRKFTPMERILSSYRILPKRLVIRKCFA